MTQHIYYKSQHRFFDSLVAFTASIASLGIALPAKANGNSSGYSPSDYLTLTGNPKISGIEFRFFPKNILSALVNNTWPSGVVFEEYPINLAPNTLQLNLTGLQRVHGAMISNAFVKYYEDNKLLVEGMYTTDRQNWPSVLNFGRVIRNALAHKGCINFTNPNAAAVTWRSLTYSPLDNGRSILYHDLTAVELIFLMEEMDATI